VGTALRKKSLLRLVWQLRQATFCYPDLTDPQERPGYANAVALADSDKIWTRGAPVRFFDRQLTDGIPLRAKDFSQS